MQQSNIGMSAALQKGGGRCPIGNHALQHSHAWKRRRGVGSNMLSPAGSPRRQSCLIAYAPPSPFARRCSGRVRGNAGGLDRSPRITVTHYCNRPADSHVINGTAAAQLYKIAHCGAVTMDMLSRNHTAPARLSRFRVQMFFSSAKLSAEKSHLLWAMPTISLLSMTPQFCNNSMIKRLRSARTEQKADTSKHLSKIAYAVA